MNTKYTLLIPGMIALSLALMSQKAPKPSRLAQQWKIVTDYQERDAAFQEQLHRIDTMTRFPEEIIKMQELLKELDKEELDQVPAETLAILRIKDLKQFKEMARAKVLEGQKKEIALDKIRDVIYDFQENGIIKMYSTDDPAAIDTSTGWKEIVSRKEILMFQNPALQDKEHPNDTFVCKILYRSADSLSIKATGKNVLPDIKPMNFRRYESIEE